MEKGKSEKPEIDRDRLLVEVKEWVKKQCHLPTNITDEQFIAFLQSCGYRLELTKKTIDTHYKLKMTTPEFFADRLPNNPGLIEVSKVVQIVLLPKKTNEDYVVIIGRLLNPDPKLLIMEDALKLAFMIVDITHKIHPNSRGTYFVNDLSGITLSHITRTKFSTMRKYFQYVQEGLPLKLKGVLNLNVTSIMTHILKVTRPFIKQELFKYIHFYPGNKMNEVFEKIPEDILPIDYGGKGPSMEKVFDYTLKLLSDHEEWFKFEATQRIDETKMNNGCSPLKASFKKLELD